jgi:hypothetical protein
MASIPFGPVTTRVPSVDWLLEYNRAGRFSAALVRTAHGVDGGWNEKNRRALLRGVETVVVGSTNGDPSYGGIAKKFWYPEPAATLAELRPWLRLRPTLTVKIGNEPDVIWEQLGQDEKHCWVYHYFLDQTITDIRAEFPQAKIIAPGPRIGTPNWHRWLEIRADVYRRCDFVGLHVYGWWQIVGDGKRELETALPVYNRLFPDKPIWITELGINAGALSAREKLARYRATLPLLPSRVAGVAFYNVHTPAEFHTEYAIPREAL